MKKAILICLAVVFGASAITNYTTVKRWTTRETLTSSDLNNTVDTINAFTGRVCDTMNSAVVRYKPTTTRDSVVQYMAIDSIRSKPDVDSIQGNPWIDTVTTRRVVADSVIGPVRGAITGNVTSTGNNTFDSIAVTKQVKSAGLNSSGPISGTTITSSSTANLDSLHTTKGATFGANVGIGKSSLEAWASGYSVLQLGGNGSFLGTTTEGAGSGITIYSNMYYDGHHKRISTDEASYYTQNSGYHAWYSDASGNADEAFTPTERMKLDSIGRLGIGNSSPSSRLDVAGGIECDSLMSAGKVTGTTGTFSSNVSVDSLFSTKGVKATNFTGSIIGGKGSFDSILVGNNQYIQGIAIDTGTLNAGGFGDGSLPTGFTYTNCVVISVMYCPSISWYYALPTELVLTTLNTYEIEISDAASAKYKIVFMRISK